MYRPQRGLCLQLLPPRLAEGSGPSGEHNTEGRMKPPNWAAFPSQTFFHPHESDFVSRGTAQGNNTHHTGSNVCNL